MSTEPLAWKVFRYGTRAFFALIAVLVPASYWSQLPIAGQVFFTLAAIVFFGVCWYFTGVSKFYRSQEN